MDAGKTRKPPGGSRSLLYFALILAALIAWRFLSPYSLPRLKDTVGEDFLKLWSQPYFYLGDLAVTPSLLIGAFFYIVFLAVVTRVTRRVARRHVIDHTSLDVGQKFALEKGLGYIVFLLGLIIGLQSMNINLSSLAVIGGALGIGIGFGLQSIARNFISGLILLIERPIKVGDRVEVGELNGDAVHLGARATWIRTNDNIVVIVPNSEFIENRVTNWTANDRQVRFSVPLGVSYGSDPEHVREVLLRAAVAHPDVLESPKPDVIFVGFGDSSLDFELRVWTTRQVQTPQVIRSELYFHIFKAFREEKIEIPFPQRDLHLKSAPAHITIAPPQA